ncbi:hypothetical protein HFP89_03685 [Wenzhouxiangella sp. XN79A]|uniref:hypothetical protein n=1 Tax=Wenzhouxiangella sp. XN79A TaxID=2724193 RepID=UPI00144A54F9|nr:hypothetical protein [Wenzhouxiangella sp. XN79A]NKI34260.1 hypothetical protein [Wenzhouxiangella sp. XN79A]
MNSKLKTSVLVAAIGAALGASVTAEAQLVGEYAAAPTLPVIEGTAVLYDQTDSPDSNGVPDQDFEAAFDVYDSLAADDFVVTDAPGWTIEVVDTLGSQSAGGSAASVDIAFHTDLGGAPDVSNPVCSYDGVVPVETAGSFTITLPTPCALPSDGSTVYWLVQQTNQDFAGGAGGQHFWSGRSVVSGAESHWVNPADGFGNGCTTFQPASVCGVGGASPGDPRDRLFALSGQVGGTAFFSTEPVPTMGNIGLGVLALGMLLLGGLAVGRRFV